MLIPAHGLGINSLRLNDRAEIRAFVEMHRGLLQGRTLDYGCGKQPYRELCGADYVGWDPSSDPFHENEPDGFFDALLCTVVIQEFRDPRDEFKGLRNRLKPGGHILIAYHPNWREVEPVDRYRYSMACMRELMADFEEVWHEPILRVQFADFAMNFTVGYVGRKPC